MTKYYFYTEGNQPLPQWTESLSRKALLHGWSKKVNPMGVFSHYGRGEGVVLEIQQILQISKYRQTIERLFAIKPTMKGVFHIDDSVISRGGEAAGIAVMLQIVSALLAMEEAEALLLTKNHDIVLRRREGLLLLNTEGEFWTPYRLSQIQHPYELRVIPAPQREEKHSPS